jgi:excisionase family DNA binding protein
MEKPKYLSPEEVGTMFRASKWTVRRWIEAGRFPAVRIGRRLLIPAEVVQKLVEEQTQVKERSSKESTVADDSLTYRITREPPTRYDYFLKEDVTEKEVERVADILIRAVEFGGWPQTVELKEDAVQRAIRGEEPFPSFFWRFLCDGIGRMRFEMTAGEDE